MLEALYNASFFLETDGELGGALPDGDLRLPPREELKALVLEETRYSDKGLTFDVYYRFLRDMRDRNRKNEEAERQHAAKAMEESQKEVLEEVDAKAWNPLDDCFLCEWLQDVYKNSINK